ncbi:F-box only protein 7 [Lepisosteus oculatus]|uniref:F-box protein 7 n=1 Tax=Lepisosteus oculatus TaxID=7918 RepID=W5NIF1_LEPOC|nr:PREDICTED: F-box only protein 7 [Lepisosteus oculatus]
MKLRVRVNKQTCRLELEGDEPTLEELSIQIKEIILPSCGYSPDTEFTLSLNSSEPLPESGQSLASCGIVSGDLICVVLSQASPAPSPSALHSVSTPPVKKTDEASSSASLQDERSGALRMPSVRAEEEDLRAEEEADHEMEDVFTPEPMICSEAEDGEVPHSLEMLFHGVENRSACDTLVVAVHLLMLETGFVLQGPEVRPGEMPAGWKAVGGVYRLQYTHPLCENSIAMVVGVPMGNMLVINATLKMNETVDNVRKIQLNPSSYVTDLWNGESAAGAYKDLKKLSRIFKDQVVYPWIASARQAMNLPAVFGLTALPPELLLRVLRLLDVGTLVALSAVSRDLSSATADPSLWRFLYHRDFRDSVSRPRDTNWKELYKKRYLQRKEAARVRRTMMFPPVPPQPFPYPPMPFHPFPFGPTPPFPPGIIGGEYDQRPGLPFSTVPRPRFDPIGPHPGQGPGIGHPIGQRSLRPSSARSSDIRRGFI